MAEGLPGKTPAESAVQMTELVLPNDANILGNMLGGRVMHYIDIAGALAAARHAGRVCVTASMERLDFLHPIRVGDVIVLEARVHWAGRTSIEVGVQVYAERIGGGERRKTCEAILTYVAVDDQGRPTPVPPVIPTTPEEEERYRQAEARAAARRRRQED
ncbi:MAG: acyl-CoA thioesterase [Bacillota bacterium]|nr:MAG: acyl-CoA thioesterase [Bacillota bacterium]